MLRSVIGSALLAADELNTRTEAASPETLTARETALEQAQGSRAATAGAHEKRPAAAVREPSQRDRDVEGNLAEPDARDLRRRRNLTQSPHSGH